MKNSVMDIIFAAGIAAALLLGGFTAFAQDCAQVRQEVLRLHIPANSDSDEDQRLKLMLRDFLLEKYGSMLSCESTRDEAIEAVGQLLAQIEADCTEYLRQCGADYSARAELVDMYFTTREYESVTLPAGEYTALRVTLGSGEGRNWWCIMFPPLCLPAASVVLDEDDVLTEFTEPESVEWGFALYEWLEKLLEKRVQD